MHLASLERVKLRRWKAFGTQTNHRLKRHKDWWVKWRCTGQTQGLQACSRLPVSGHPLNSALGTEKACKKRDKRKKEFSIGGKVSAGNRRQGQRRHFNQRENNTDQHARKPPGFFEAMDKKRRNEEVQQKSSDHYTISPHVTGQMVVLNGSCNNSFSLRKQFLSSTFPNNFPRRFLCTVMLITWCSQKLRQMVRVEHQVVPSQLTPFPWR